jgi:uncharacterized protein YwgA
MVAQDLKAWPEEYSVVFALGSCSGQVRGKVKLNKALALLQRDGFPIPNKFINHKMGPYDAKLDSITEEMENDHFISIVERETSFENARCEYTLKKEGRDYYVQEWEDLVIPLFNTPYSKALLENFRKTTKDVLELKTKDLVESVHKDLGLDKPNHNDDLAMSMLTEVKKEFEFAEKNYDECCPACLEILGSLDFASRALNSIIEFEKPVNGWKTIILNDYSGNRFIIFNSLKLVELSRCLRNHDHVTDVRLEGDDSFPLMRSRILLRLHSTEYIGNLYDIIKPLEFEADEAHCTDA